MHYILRARWAGFIFSFFFLTGVTAIAAAKEFKINSTDGIRPIYSQSRALLIGVDKYKSWPALSTVPDELDNLRSALIRQGFERKDIKIVMDPVADVMKKEIEVFFMAPADSQTRLFLYFAGHGFTDGKSTGYIIGSDAPPKRHPDLKRYSLGLDIISIYSEQSSAKHALLVFDSCFSGAIFLTRGAANLPSPLFIADAERKVRQFITSGSEFDEVPSQSAFIEQFIIGMDGGADTVIDGIVTANELGYWLKATLTPLGKQTPQYGSSTTREFRYGDVMFASLKASQLSGSALGTKKIPVSSNSNGTRGSPSRESMTPRIDQFDAQIYYYAKHADGGKVEKALDAESIPYFKTRAIRLPDRFEVNALACGPDVPIAQVKAIALALTRGDVPVRAIIPFDEPEKKKRRIEILSLSENSAGATSLDTTPLTEAQINSIKNCSWFQNKTRTQKVPG